MQERCLERELLVDVADEQLAHLAELGEHERPFTLIEQLGDQLVESGELARSPGEA